MTTETIALVSCVKKKRAARCPAQDLYDSDLFRKMRCYAKQHSDRWFILSAKYGLLSPETEIEPYEQTLNNMRIRDRREWADTCDAATAQPRRAIRDVLAPSGPMSTIRWHRS